MFYFILIVQITMVCIVVTHVVLWIIKRQKRAKKSKGAG
jgi:hypothetical protein